MQLFENEGEEILAFSIRVAAIVQRSMVPLVLTLQRIKDLNNSFIKQCR